MNILQKFKRSDEFKFKTNHSFDARKAESVKMKAKYPDRIAIICEQNANSTLPLLDKMKYLVPNDLTIGQFYYVIRKRLKLSSHQAIFFFIDNHIPNATAFMKDIYSQYQDPDGFLYIRVTEMNTFG